MWKRWSLNRVFPRISLPKYLLPNIAMYVYTYAVFFKILLPENHNLFFKIRTFYVLFVHDGILSRSFDSEKHYEKKCVSFFIKLNLSRNTLSWNITLNGVYIIPVARLCRATKTTGWRRYSHRRALHRACIRMTLHFVSAFCSALQTPAFVRVHEITSECSLHVLTSYVRFLSHK